MKTDNTAPELQPGVEAALPRTKGIAVKNGWMRRLVTFLVVFGPGLIVMEADNDAGAVSSYTQAGAQYGTKLLWVMLLLLPMTYFVQEMVVRLGIATGKGHASMIFERFGKFWGYFSLGDLLLVNFLTLVTEFAGISLAMSQLGVSPYVSVPTAAVGLIGLVVTGSYRRWEALTIVLCLLDVTWFVVAWATHTAAGQIAFDTLVPQVPAGGITSNLVFLVIAIVGTTIAPWQLFFQQSAVADKRLRFKDLRSARLDTFLGACFTVAVAGCMMLAGNVLHQRHLEYTDPAQMAVLLGRILGPWGKTTVLLLMVNAAVLGTTAISLSSAWAYGEYKKWPHSLERKLKDAPGFYGVYAACVCAAGALVLIPKAPLQLIILGVQVLAGVVLPSAIIFLQLLLNDREMLGEKWINKPWNNAINWTIICLFFVLSLILAAQVVAPSLFPAS